MKCPYGHPQVTQTQTYSVYLSVMGIEISTIDCRCETHTETTGQMETKDLFTFDPCMILYDRRRHTHTQTDW